MRDWRIWSDLAAVPIRRARKLYANDALGVDLDNTVYALDSNTIDPATSLEQGLVWQTGFTVALWVAMAVSW